MMFDEGDFGLDSYDQYPKIMSIDEEKGLDDEENE